MSFIGVLGQRENIYINLDNVRKIIFVREESINVIKITYSNGDSEDFKIENDIIYKNLQKIILSKTEPKRY